MQSMAVKDTQLLVLADEGTEGSKGGLFERFVARLLAEHYGFEDPTRRTLNVTSEGIELDVVATHRLTGGTAIAECKAYSRNVKAAELTNFYGKLTIERFEDDQAFGLFCALPRLTPEGLEKARRIERQDNNFRYLSGEDLANALLRAGIISGPPSTIADSSDPAVVVTELGVFAACIVLDKLERTPTQIAIWANSSRVPGSVLELVRISEYAKGMPVHDAGVGDQSATQKGVDPESASIFLTPVAGSSSDFEYQLPASPQYFVGRKGVIDRLNRTLTTKQGRVVVLNAQSGWGKSSLALKVCDVAKRRKGVALALDTRTADHPRYVSEALRRLATEAQAATILELPSSASWASLDSALRTLREAKWKHLDRPIVAFFDQFENVFRDSGLTRSFRELALGSRDIPGPLIIGFAWKTDLVGWIEGHPFQLRDDIRGAGTVVIVDPFGPSEVTVLLSRLDKQAGTRLLPDLRSRLRAYSQGLPWLLKKLADHVLRELTQGVTQEQLLAESLNVVGLFEADLAELNPSQHEVVQHVARFAPIAATKEKLS